MFYKKIFLILVFSFITGIFGITADYAYAEEACCIVKGPNASARYEADVKTAVTTYLKDHPEIGEALGGTSKMGVFLTGVADILTTMGYGAGRVSNCSENPDRPSNESLIVGKPGETYGDRYDMLKSYQTTPINQSTPSFTALERMTHCLGSSCGGDYGDPPPKKDEVDCFGGEIPPPPPTESHYSCISEIGGTTQYCSNDATGKYTTSNCDGFCGPAIPTTRYSCVNQACFVDPNGFFSSCIAAACTIPVVEAKPPVITKIQPTTAPVAAQILVEGSDLGGIINLLYPDGTTSVSFNGYLDDASKTLVKFDVPDLPVGIYKVRGFGWGKYASEMAVSPQDLTIKSGGDDFTDTVSIGVPTGYKSLGELITFIFVWSLRLLGITVFVMIFYAGVLWMTAAGNTSQVGEAKARMTNAVLGAVLLLSAYLILYTVNPDLVGGEWTLPGIGTEN